MVLVVEDVAAEPAFFQRARVGKEENDLQMGGKVKERSITSLRESLNNKLFNL